MKEGGEEETWRLRKVVGREDAEEIDNSEARFQVQFLYNVNTEVLIKEKNPFVHSAYKAY